MSNESSDSVADSPRGSCEIVPGDAEQQTLWARTLLAALAEAGIRDVVISPGSRSTPFVLAASQHPDLTCHDIMDERAAAYFALGQARISGLPSLLLCTSGTAVANYLPAVIEAGMAFVPVVILSADRPIELVDCGSNQTIDQLKIFGQHARRFFDLGLWDTAPRALRALRRSLAQAVFATTYPLPGAVHLNARAKKPLEPSEPTLTPVPGGAQATPHRPMRLASDVDLDALGRRMEACQRVLLAAGPSPVEQGTSYRRFFELARRCGGVVFADPASQWRFAEAPPEVAKIDRYDCLLHSKDFRRRWRPDLIVQIGRVPTSGVFDAYLEELVDVEHWVIDPHGWNDPQSTADHLLFGDVDPTLRALSERLSEKANFDTKWQQAWRDGNSLTDQVIDTELTADRDALSEGQIASSAVASLGSENLLVLGNSLPIREVDIFCRGREKLLKVASQRGTSGIEGVVSGAIGAAQKAGTPTLLLIGDVSFLHDIAGLAAARLVRTPLVILVVQNQGGRIFEQLPVSQHLQPENEPATALDDSPMRHWLTPHNFELQHAAGLYGLSFEQVKDITALKQALDRGLGQSGTTVIEALVPPHGAAEQSRRLRQQVRQVLAGAGLE